MNSWGTAGGLRPNGIFRLNMDMNYGCVYYDSGVAVPVFYWQTLDISFDRDILYVEPSGICNGKTPCYGTIQRAIDAAGILATILVTAGTYEEDINLNTSKNLILKGGYNTTYTVQASNTTVNSLTSSSGHSVVDRFVLQ